MHDSINPYHLAERFGVRIIIVPDLGQQIVYVEDQRIALIDDRLSYADHQWAADWLMNEVLAAAIVT